MSTDAPSSGSIACADEPARLTLAVRIAGVLAECAVQRLTIADPRICRWREVEARVTNLPSELATAAPGTTFQGEGVALLVDEGCVRWVASGEIAMGLMAITGTPPVPGGSG